MLEILSPEIALTREEQHVIKQIINNGNIPMNLGEEDGFLTLVTEDPDLSHWTPQDREDCMTKLQNLGLLAIKTAECMGARV